MPLEIRINGSSRGSVFRIFWVIPLAVLLLIGGCLIYLGVLGRYASYENKDFDFSIKYPIDWSVKVKPDPAHPEASVVFLSPKEGGEDTFIENVNIVVQDLPGDIKDLQGLAKQAVDQLTSTFKDLQILQNEPITVLSGLEGQKIIFASKEENSLKIMTVVFVVNKRSYQIFFTAILSSFDQYLPLVNDMIASFQMI